MSADFSTRLQLLMNQKKLTLRTISDAVGASTAAVHKWCTGGDIKYEKLRLLASYLDVNWVWLRYGEEALSSVNANSSDMTYYNRLRMNQIAEIHHRENLLTASLSNARIAAWKYNLITNYFEIIHDAEVFGSKLVSFTDFNRILFPDDIKSRQKFLESALQNNLYYECKYRIKRLDNKETCWIQDKGKPVIDFAGRTIEICGVSFDITKEVSG
jgi:transcriptional regulator with XRE-family HTH domain